MWQLTSRRASVCEPQQMPAMFKAKKNFDEREFTLGGSLVTVVFDWAMLLEVATMTSLEPLNLVI